MIGRRYLLRGEPVTVLARWRTPTPEDIVTAVCDECGSMLLLGGYDEIPHCFCAGDPPELNPGRRIMGERGGPRNVLIRHEFLPGNTLSVRPFRGLRRER